MSRRAHEFAETKVTVNKAKEKARKSRIQGRPRCADGRIDRETRRIARDVTDKRRKKDVRACTYVEVDSDRSRKAKKGDREAEAFDSKETSARPKTRNVGNGGNRNGRPTRADGPRGTETTATELETARQSRRPSQPERAHAHGTAHR